MKLPSAAFPAGETLGIRRQVANLNCAASTCERASERAMKRTSWPLSRNWRAPVSIGPRSPGVAQDATRKLYGMDLSPRKRMMISDYFRRATTFENGVTVVAACFVKDGVVVQRRTDVSIPLQEPYGEATFQRLHSASVILVE